MRTIKEIRRLLSETAYRAEARSFIAEGKKIVADFLRYPHNVAYCVVDSERYVSDTTLKQIVATVHDKEVVVSFVESKTFARISSLKTNQGILAEIRMPCHTKAALLKKESALIAVGDGIQDPRNVGALVRNTVAFNGDAVIFTPGSADVYSPKGLRAASGSVLDIPIVYMSNDELVGLKRESVHLMAAALDGAEPIDTIKQIPCRTAVIFGNEGAGVSNYLLEHSDTSFYIPISNRINSLNITSAAAVTLFHIASIRAQPL